MLNKLIIVLATSLLSMSSGAFANDDVTMDDVVIAVDNYDENAPIIIFPAVSLQGALLTDVVADVSDNCKGHFTLNDYGYVLCAVNGDKYAIFPVAKIKGKGRPAKDRPYITLYSLEWTPFVVGLESNTLHGETLYKLVIKGQ